MEEKWKKIRSKSKKLMYEGFTRDGKPFGSGTSYYENGNKCQEGVFDAKGLVYGREYYQNGNIRFEGTYRSNKGYGPNYPVFGYCYDEDGNEFYYGELKINRSGLGWPSVRIPQCYGPVVPNGAPDFSKRIWSTENNIPGGVYFVRPRGNKARTEFVVFLEKNGFKCQIDEATSRESTIESKYPIRVDLDKKLYGHIHSTTCAAVVANSRLMCSVDRLCSLLECAYSFVVV